MANSPHTHTFGQDVKRPGENRTLIVIAITSAMMVIEIIAGIAYGSMALLADGLHMASHTAALSINAFAYVYARRRARDSSFSFGTGKVNTLGGYTGAILLAGFAWLMVYESISRLVSPVPIAFNQAIIVAIIGLIVNGVSMLILDHRSDRGDTHHDHGHGHGHGHSHSHGKDHNLVSAYLHVLADALTSLLAIFALLAAKYYGLNWFDPLMGIVGAVLVARWSWGLLKSTSAVLLDRTAADDMVAGIRQCIESPEEQIVDLHVWSIGPDIYAAIIAINTRKPVSADDYRRRLEGDPRLVHVTIEINKAL